MFANCNSLTKAPDLPALTLAPNSYSFMFVGCTSLSYIKALFLTTPGQGFTEGWVEGVASTGTFVKNPEATWEVIGDDGIPEGWTVGNVQ